MYYVTINLVVLFAWQNIYFVLWYLLSQISFATNKCMFYYWEDLEIGELFSGNPDEFYMLKYLYDNKLLY